MGIPDENVPMFVAHLVLGIFATAVWVLCIPIFDASFPSHIHAWIVTELCLAALETLYAVWASIVDARDPTFYERKSETFFVVDIVFIIMNTATAVTGAAYWRNGERERQLIFDAVVILSWLTLLTVVLITGQDKVKMSSS
mmetsp:Transcript_12452/g.50089  ORF Transcript_12452/g.50089 Transcript_12452/m.50089 type:complete len:141 (+) Transcript_12452:106-528(+)|eukprot:CAMPEP_0185692254 /NCGR_PEP_ID=MMETSP1164-20130828/2408_1 /TAXON_ID=1104430 /ORGANISM="Chrysoreinhardia sp, Strain CCMP2950" /LENGTH=140 /DNA_ID=CAMNT_0028358973 /DNA_START=94 /DNA_END=516 /DNA_ORIENTATION=+